MCVFFLTEVTLSSCRHAMCRLPRTSQRKDFELERARAYPVAAIAYGCPFVFGDVLVQVITSRRIAIFYSIYTRISICMSVGVGLGICTRAE